MRSLKPLLLALSLLTTGGGAATPRDLGGPADIQAVRQIYTIRAPAPAPPVHP